jgi:CRISPR-associated endonuclease Csn1
MKKILGLDLGTNSIGWALVNHNFENKQGEILGMGSRIIPMSANILGDFEKGNPVSATAERTSFRGVRRLIERDLLRRERLHRVLNIIGFLPQHYANDIDFEHRLGQFKKDKEPKIAYKKNSDGKHEFIFQESFKKMVDDFRKTQPQLFYTKPNGEESKIPYDWTIYYLRKKALKEKIEKEELAWILLNFNQKRGYYQLRGEEEEKTNIKEYCELLKVISVEKGEQDKKNDKRTWYKITFENGWEYSATFTEKPNWLNTEREFLITEEYDDEGNIKIIKDKKSDTTGKEKRKITPLPSFQEIDAMSKEDQNKIYKKIKARTEITIENSKKTVGEYIYDTLLKEPNQKIRGKLIRTIERKFYKDELRQILKEQKKHHSELQDEKLYNVCINELYEYNEAHKNNIAKKDFTYLFIDDIIFYQRPLKSKKSLISNCSLEFRTFKVDGVERHEGIKCISKSNPIYQEFRLLQWMKNLKIFKKDDRQDIDITDELLPNIAEREKLFEWLNDRSEIEQTDLLKYPPFKLEEKIKEQLGLEQFRIFKKDKQQGLQTYYRWNYVEDKKYPLNETRGEILKRLKKLGIANDFLTKEVEKHLWHILYSVEDSNEVHSALNKFANKYNLPESFVETFKKYPRIKKEYGAYSEKAIKKLLTLMRFGKWWDFSAIDETTKDRIGKIQTGEFDEKIKNRVREKTINLTENSHFQDLPLWLASYIIYNRHSETSEITHWKTANDIKLLKQHSLRNPIVEQVINETLQTIRDIWNHYGDGKENFFDEIHVELGRDLKNHKDKRKKISKQVSENEKTNIRIKAILTELKNEGHDNVRPYSPTQQEILKLYEEGIYLNENSEEKLKEIDNIRKQTQPSSSEIKRYKLWLEQGYKSPYTGEIIPLSKLFTTAYQIEHIIPQSRFFDDSFNNKVICESEINELKDNQLAFEFIKNNKELTVELSHGKFVKLLHPEVYEENVKRYFAKNKTKMKNLLLEDIPDRYIKRQLNDTRYISKVVKMILSNIVREENEEEGTAKNIIVSNGAITNRLKQDWGLNDVWNTLITPRFERLNKMAEEKKEEDKNKYGSWVNKEGKKVFQINSIEPELLKLDKKRIDHRHHAMDALIVACTSRNHVNYLNNVAAAKDKQSERFDLRAKLRQIESFTDKNGKKRTVAKEFLKPWDTFTQDAKKELNHTVVSFKKNNRVINKTVNYYQKWVKQPGGSMKKMLVKQEKGDSWAIRKPLHVPMPYGLKEYSFDNLKIAENVGKKDFIIDDYIRNEVEKHFDLNNRKITDTQKFLKKNPIKDKYGNIILTTDFNIRSKKFRKRMPILKLADRSSGRGITSLDSMIKFLNKISDKTLKNDLFSHLKDNDNDINVAFSIEGIERFNSKRKTPVYKLPITESGEKRFVLGNSIGSKHKWVEAEAGTNLFFAIYVDNEGNRNYETIPLNIVIERQKQGLPSCPELNEKGHNLLFDLSPNDLVYVPSLEEQENPNSVDFNNLSEEQVKRIYKFVSCTGIQGYFVPNTNASEIIKNENGTNSKSERVQDFYDNKTILDNSGKPIQIKSVCWKLETNRLGQIKKVLR